MKNQLRRLWQFVNTPVGEIFTLDNLESQVDRVKDATEAIFTLAETLPQEAKNNQQIAYLVSKTSTLFDVLNSPWGQVINSSLPFLPFATGLLKLYFDITKKEPTISECVALVTQAAYLQSLQDFIRNNQDLSTQLQANENE